MGFRLRVNLALALLSRLRLEVMAFGRFDRAVGPRPMSDINMTPLIDVVLVLLVIFMITAPLMTSALKLELPSAASAQPTDPSPFILVGLDAKGQRYLGDKMVSEADFTAGLNAAALQTPPPDVHLHADRNVPYGRVAELMGTLQKAGLTRIGFVTEPPSSAPAQPLR